MNVVILWAAIWYVHPLEYSLYTSLNNFAKYDVESFVYMDEYCYCSSFEMSSILFILYDDVICYDVIF